MDSFKVFQRYIDTRNNLNFDNLVPNIEINEKELTERVVLSYNSILKEEVKFKQSIETLIPWTEKEKPKLIQQTQPVHLEDANELHGHSIFDPSKLGLPTGLSKKNEEGMIVMNLAIPKNIINNKRSSRSMTRKSTAMIMSKDKRDSKVEEEIPESLQAVFNIPFLLPQMQESKKTKTNEIKMTVKLGNKMIKEAQEHIDNFMDWLNRDQMSFLRDKDLKQFEVSRVNDECNLRQDIMKKAFFEIPFQKRHILILSFQR